VEGEVVMNPITMEGLRDAYLAALEAERAAAVGRNPARAESLRNLIKNTRSTYAKFDALPDASASAMSVAEFSTRFDALAGALTTHLKPPPGTSSAHVSRMRKMLAWAAAGGRFEPPAKLAETLGYPPMAEFLGSNPSKLTVRFTRRFYAFVTVDRISPSRMGENAFSEFVAECDMTGRDLDAALLGFGRNWSRLHDADELPPPPMEFPGSRKPESYAAKLDEIPGKLRSEIGRMCDRLKGRDIRGRHGRRPPDDRTVEMHLEHLLRLIGVLVRHGDLRLTDALGIKDIVTVANVRLLLDITNEQSLQRFGLEPTQPNEKKRFGHSQSMIAASMRVIAERWIGDDARTKKLANLHRGIRRRAETRRESLKEFGKLNDYFHIARELLRKSDAPPRPGFGRFQRAILRRDALLFVLLGLFAYREELVTILRAGHEIQAGAGNTLTISVGKEHTKPGLRDLLHEIPEEFTFLFRHVMDVENPILCGRKCNTGALFVSCQGSPLKPAGVYNAFTRRTREILGRERNPHLVRSAWATEFLIWSKGDYLNASHIVDANPSTMQKHYVRICRKQSIASFDQHRDAAAARAVKKIEEDGL
jgi:hypothetical protein